tara:strand:- start:118 stop:357 length:240 start_codon:yes stop_codon:yes gene_type:complete
MTFETYSHTYKCGITTYTLDNFTKDDETVKVGYACSMVGIGTDMIHEQVKIPKLDSGEIDYPEFYGTLKGKLLKINGIG